MWMLTLLLTMLQRGKVTESTDEPGYGHCIVLEKALRSICGMKYPIVYVVLLL